MTDPTLTLQTSFALDLMTDIAAPLSAQAFYRMFAPVFGDDLPKASDRQLQDALRSGSLSTPVHRVTAQVQGKASYDNATRVIELHPQVIDAALQRPNAACELATILLHEFGHHLDNVLRQDLAHCADDGCLMDAEH